MADISDVEQVVADTITSILYPAGPSQPSIVGLFCRIYRGWPNTATLNNDLGSGVVNVTICADNDNGRTTTRYLPRWQSVAGNPGTVVAASGGTIVISGSPALGDIIGAIVDGIAYAYRVCFGDTPGLIAANLSAVIRTERISVAHGRVIAIPGSSSIIVRVVCDQSAFSETRRQEKDLRVIFWCPTPAIRDAVVVPIDTAINEIRFLTLPDTTQARIIYRNTVSHDQAQNALLYRRDLIYTVEYPTVSTAMQPSMLLGESDLNGSVRYG